MRKVAAITGILALGFLSTAAVAAGWVDFESAFPVTPCQDGWAGCIVDGDSISADMVRDGSGAPMPADLRVGWFDLQGTAAFSPFPSLSSYTGELPGDAIADGGGDDGGGGGEDTAVAEVTGDQGGSDGGGSNGGGSTTTTRTDSGGGSAPDPVGGNRTATNDGGSNSGGDDGGSKPVVGGNRSATNDGGSNSGGDDGGSKPVVGGNRSATNDGGGDEVVAKNDGTGGGVSISDLNKTGGNRSGTADGGDGGKSNIIQQAIDADPPVVDSGDCSNIKLLEPKAMLGKLTAGQTECLEGELKAASRQTDKDKISRVLMTNAWSAGDRKTWEKLVKRHLDEIDRSDPDICYKYALHLNKKGVGSANGVIRWSDVALENRTVWTGSTYTNRVNSLYKLRAAAAQKLWKSAEDKYAAEASDANRVARERAKDRTKVLAREWYEYAKSAGKNADSARALCISAAGTEDYCEGA